MTTKTIQPGIVRIVPDEGKRLYNTTSGQHYSEAVVKEENANNFIEVE